MAKKKAVKSPATPKGNGNGKADADLVQEAYGDAVKNQVKMLIDHYISNTPDAEKKFTAGLKIIRKAREQALELVKE